jgi:hypothetical protein
LQEGATAPAPAPAAVAAGPFVPPHPSSYADTPCGELALRRIELRALGRGDRHPDVIAVEERLARCPDRSPSPEACERVRREALEVAHSAAGYGAAHPVMLAAQAKVAACVGVAAPPPPVLTCDNVLRWRAELIAHGKGEAHPLMIWANAQLEACQPRHSP